MNYGVATVNVPTTHKGRLEACEPEFWRYKQSTFSATFDDTLTEATFYDSLRSALGAPGHDRNQILIFILVNMNGRSVARL